MQLLFYILLFIPLIMVLMGVAFLIRLVLTSFASMKRMGLEEATYRSNAQAAIALQEKATVLAKRLDTLEATLDREAPLWRQR